jgi:hypothetical protein
LTADDIREIAKERRRRGKKFKSMTINMCNVLNSKVMVNACLELADEVSGFCGMTGYSPKYKFREPYQIPKGKPSPDPKSLAVDPTLIDKAKKKMPGLTKGAKGQPGG